MKYFKCDHEDKYSLQRIQTILLTEALSSDMKTRILKGSFWSFIGSICGRGLVLIAFILLAHILQKEIYGQVGMIRSTINMFIAFSSLGIGITASKYIANYRDLDKDKAEEIYWLSHYFSIIIGIIIVVAILITAPLIANYSLHASYLTFDIRLGAMVIFFTLLNGAQSGALSGFEDFKSIAINTIIYGMLQGIFITIGGYFLSIEGVIVGMGVASIVLWFLNYRAIKKKLKTKWFGGLHNIRNETVSLLWKYSLPAALSSMLVVPVLWYCKSLLVRKAGFSEMALYDVAEQWNNIILLLPAALSQIILPILSNILSLKDNRQYMKVVKLNLFFNFTVAFIIAMFASLSHNLILHLYGNAFLSNPSPFLWMMLAVVLISVNNVIGQVIASKDNMWIGLGLNVIWAMWLLLFSYIFVVNANMGATGLALALTISYAFHTVFQTVYAFRNLRQL